MFEEEARFSARDAGFPAESVFIFRALREAMTESVHRPRHNDVNMRLGDRGGPSDAPKKLRSAADIFGCLRCFVWAGLWATMVGWTSGMVGRW